MSGRLPNFRRGKDGTGNPAEGPDPSGGSASPSHTATGTALLRRVGGLGGWLGLGAILLLCAASLWVGVRYRSRMLPASEVPPAKHALVFGAGLSKGEPSDVLRERIDAAVALYRLGRVSKLLVSGDNWDRRHEETEAMRRYAEAAGVPAEDILEDPAGLSTYDSCYRAREVFGVERAILVTQHFHLPRALYIANGLGLDAYGVASDHESPEHWTSMYAVREFFSRALAAAMVAFEVKPKIEGPASRPGSRRRG